MAVPGLEVDAPFRAQYDWQSTEGLDDARVRPAVVSQITLGEHDGFFVINGRIKATFEHPFLIRRGDAWGFCSADLLRIGDHLVTPDLNEEPITTIERIPGRVRTASITVPGTNTSGGSGSASASGSGSGSGSGSSSGSKSSGSSFSESSSGSGSSSSGGSNPTQLSSAQSASGSDNQK